MKNTIVAVLINVFFVVLGGALVFVFLPKRAIVEPVEPKTVTGVELAADLNGLIQTIQMCDASSTPETITVTFKDFGLGENSYVVSCK